MIFDFHTHILPGIDDGSKTVEDSVKMLQMEVQQGIRRVIATPHFYAHHDTPSNFLTKRKEAECRLREEMSKYSDMPELLIGAEVHYFSGISESDVVYELTIDKKKCILLELPQAPWNEKIYKELTDIWERHGIIPIIAHVDRYIHPLRTFGIPQRLSELPVKVQANSSFFVRRSTRHMALKMLKNGQIHVLGSDCHSLNTRAPNLGAAEKIIRLRFGDEMISQLDENGYDLLENKISFDFI